MSTPAPLSPLVGIVMGSDSDWPVMEAAAAALSEFGIPFEADVVSAHRMPAEMIAYGRGAAARGIRVIIAGAGGAAHLPGMLASVTTLPVVGVPVPLKTLDGMDSLLSIVQMPAGVPVATVSIGGARNAGLLAVRILAAGTDALAAELAVKLADFAADLNRAASAKGAVLREQAGHNYPLAVPPTAPRDPMGDRASDVASAASGGPTAPRDPMGDRASDVASAASGGPTAPRDPMGDRASDVASAASGGPTAPRDPMGDRASDVASAASGGPTAPRDPMGDRASDVASAASGGPTAPRDPMGDRASDVASGGAGD